MRIRIVESRLCDRPTESRKVTDGLEVAAVLRTMFEPESDPQENLFVIYFTSRSTILGVERVYRGTVNSAMVSTRDVVRGALLSNAASVILAHNHPSGDPEPSAEDIAFTRKMSQALGLLDVALLDHVVMGDGRHHSMKERGQL